MLILGLVTILIVTASELVFPIPDRDTYITGNNAKQYRAIRANFGILAGLVACWYLASEQYCEAVTSIPHGKQGTETWDIPRESVCWTTTLLPMLPTAVLLILSYKLLRGKPQSFSAILLVQSVLVATIVSALLFFLSAFLLVMVLIRSKRWSLLLLFRVAEPGVTIILSTMVDRRTKLTMAVRRGVFLATLGMFVGALSCLRRTTSDLTTEVVVVGLVSTACSSFGAVIIKKRILDAVPSSILPTGVILGVLSGVGTTAGILCWLSVFLPGNQSLLAWASWQTSIHVTLTQAIEIGVTFLGSNLSSLAILRAVDLEIYVLLKGLRQLLLAMYDQQQAQGWVNPALILGSLFVAVGVVFSLQPRSSSSNGSQRMAARSITLLGVVCLIIQVAELISFRTQRRDLFPRQQSFMPQREMDGELDQRIRSHVFRDTATSVDLQDRYDIVFAWTSVTREIPLEFVENIKRVAAMHSGRSIAMFCSTDSCVDKTRQRIRGISMVQLSTRELMRNTVLEKWIADHPLHKMLLGPHYPDVLHTATVLALQAKIGGIFMSPRVSLDETLPANAFSSDWCWHELTTLARSNGTSILRRMQDFVMMFPKEGDLAEMKWEDWPWTGPDLEDIHRCGVGEALGGIEARLDVDSRIPEPTQRYLAFSPEEGNTDDALATLAAIQWMPYIDGFMDDRKPLDATPLENATSVETCPILEQSLAILNGRWRRQEAWAPKFALLEPVVVGLQWEETITDALVSDDSQRFLHRFAPVGAMDEKTLEILESAGVPSFLSGSLLMTMQNPNGQQDRKGHFAVDVPDWILQMVPSEMQVEQISLNDTKTDSGVQLFTKSWNMLRKFSNAEAVVTSDESIAVLCAALGTPVVLIIPRAKMGLTIHPELAKLVHVYDEEEGRNSTFDRWHPPPNPLHVPSGLEKMLQKLVELPVLRSSSIQFGTVSAEFGSKLVSFASGQSVLSVYSTQGKANARPYLWLYWDAATGTDQWDGMPALQRICLASIYKENGDDFEITMVSKRNIQGYLHKFQLPSYFNDLPTNIQGDLGSIALLAEHGGVYADTDVVALKPLKELLYLLAEHEFVGYHKDDHCYPLLDDKLSSGFDHGVMIVRPHSQLMAQMYHAFIGYLENTGKCRDGGTCETFSQFGWATMIFGCGHTVLQMYFQLHSDTFRCLPRAQMEPVYWSDTWKYFGLVENFDLTGVASIKNIITTQNNTDNVYCVHLNHHGARMNIADIDEWKVDDFFNSGLAFSRILSSSGFLSWIQSWPQATPQFFGQVQAVM